MKTTVKTNLAVGKTKNFYFGEKSEHHILMYDNIPFKKEYNKFEDFFIEFFPNTPSMNLINRIQEEFEKGGKITYKPRSYKSNQTFYFEKN